MSDDELSWAFLGDRDPDEVERELAAILADALAANEIATAELDDFPGVQAAEVGGSFGRWHFFAQTDLDSLGVLAYSVFPSPVPAKRRPAVAELAARVNYLLRHGDLEMDFSDGEVRVRTSARGGPEVVPLHVAAEVVRANLGIAELLFPAVSAVATEGAEPSDAVQALADGSSEA